MEIPTREPVGARAGDTWTWRRAFDDYSSQDAWVLSYAMVGPGAVRWDATWAVAEVDGGWLVTMPATQTAGIPAGAYQWIARVAKAGEVVTVATGALTVEPNLATATPGSLETHAAKMLRLIDAEITRRLTPASEGGSGAVESYSIDEVSMAKVPLRDLQKMRGQFAAQVARQRRPGSLGTPVAFAFTEPGA